MNSLNIGAANVKFHVPHFLEMGGACNSVIEHHPGQEGVSRRRRPGVLLYAQTTARLLHDVVQEMEHIPGR